MSVFITFDRMKIFLETRDPDVRQDHLHVQPQKSSDRLIIIMVRTCDNILIPIHFQFISHLF